ncbi:MAG: GerMN domain-containing protein, partial [Clostridia bacterium]|nr:GerMN domain-containing protein [Clostridia bacterium]
MKRPAALFLIIGLLATGCSNQFMDNVKARFAVQDNKAADNNSLNAEGAVPVTAPEETIKITLYFSSPDGDALVPETRNVKKSSSIARVAMEELIKGPTVESGLLPTIPKGSRLRDINIRPDGLARVDFTSELIANHKGGSMAENLTVYSIVNTLCEFPTVKQVQILVDGKVVETIAGHVSIRE